MQAQPPPDAPAPPPSEAAVISQNKWTWLLIGGVSCILILLFVVPPFLFTSRKKADQTEAVNNIRQIGYALFEFETEYGRLPDGTTIAAVKAKTSTDLDLGTKTSNDFFRQLIATGITRSEPMFYAKVAGVRRPDGVTTKGVALKKGECGFTYFPGMLTTDNPDRPLVATPMIPGTDRFDPKKFDGKAVFLTRDSAVHSYPIDKSGHLLLHGRNVMDPHHPVWDGHPPMVAWPDL